MNSELNEKRRLPVVSTKLADGGMAELVFSSVRGVTTFSVHRNGLIVEQDAIETESGDHLVPISAENNLIKHRALLLPEKAEEYESVHELAAIIGGYLYRYVDLSDRFRKIAAYYVLLTWVYDAFNELPYLRLRGDFGSGKTRALSVIGSICYRPFFASGASTVSPIFHTLDSFGSTLVLDEADFRFSDEKSELVKIFNNGNVRGFPVLRSAVSVKREFDPRAFNVFGPKIVAMRESFEDQALESRFLTEEMGQRKLRSDIPINLPKEQQEEALTLRNKLLMYRFDTLPKVKVNDSLVDAKLSPRLNQILVPLLSIIEDEKLRENIRDTVQDFERTLYSERSSSMEAGVLEVLAELFEEKGEGPVSIGEVTAGFAERYAMDYERPITNKLIGGVLRRRLRITTYKTHGTYVVPSSEKSKVAELSIRHGVTKEVVTES